MWVWPKKTCCPGRRGVACNKQRPKNALTFAQTKEGKAVVGGKDGGAPKGNSGGGNQSGGGGGGGGGVGGGDAKNLAKELRQAKEEIKKLQSVAVVQEDEDADSNDEEMDDDLKTEDDWKRVIEKSKANEDYANACLKKWPKEPQYMQMAEAAKAQIEEAKQRMGQLRSPSDQLQQKLNREKKLNGLVRAAREHVKEKLLVVLEAEEDIEVTRERLHEWQDELQLIASQKVALVASAAAPTGPPHPIDMANCLEAMRVGLGGMFDDQRLSAEDRAKKPEVEAGFLAMRNIFSIISGVQMAYAHACKTSDTPDSNGGGSIPTNTTADEPGMGIEQNKGTTENAGTGNGTEQGGDAPKAPATVVEPSPEAAPSQGNVTDGPASERAGRDRTPPPSSDKRRALAKITDDEIAGARKAKGAATKGKAGTKSTA